jgi:hypothetical protein
VFVTRGVAGLPRRDLAFAARALHRHIMPEDGGRVDDVGSPRHLGRRCDADEPPGSKRSKFTAPVKLVIWNVNSLKVRLPRVLEFLAEHAP